MTKAELQTELNRARELAELQADLADRWRSRFLVAMKAVDRVVEILERERGRGD